MLKSSFFRTLLLVLITLPTIIFTSCDDDDETPTVNDIVAVASSDANFSFLVAALETAELVETLQGAGPFTVFAPTNDAFIAAGFANEAAVRAAGKDALTPILLNHVVSGNVASTDLSDGQIAGSLSTVGAGTASNLYFAVSSSGVWVNEAKITTTDLTASNGVIHVVDKVLTTGSIADFVINNPNFSTLEVGVTTAPASLATSLSGAGTFTVFAPDNAAFDAFVAETNTDLSTLTDDNFEAIILTHALGSEVYSDGIPSASVSSLNMVPSAQNLTFDGTATFTDPTNRSINIVKTDIKLSNGVIHIISNVITPTVF